MPRPEAGRPLPRAADAYVEDAKWWGYILAPEGHGRDWERVFGLERGQAEDLWERFAQTALTAPVASVRETAFGVGCATRLELTFNGRTAPVVLGWFYDHPDDAPRLVTAYPAS